MQSFGLETRFGKAVLAEVYINGALVADMAPGQMTMQSLAIHHEVVPGANQAEVVATIPAISPFQPPMVAQGIDPADFFIELSLERDTVEDLGDSYRITTEVIDEQQWRPADSGGQLVLPHRMRIAFDAPPTLLPPVWSRAIRVEPADVRADVIRALTALQGLIQRRDFDGFQREMALRNQDMARAFPLSGSAEERARIDSATLAEALPPGPLRMAPIDPASLQIRTFADGRIIDCRAADGRPPLRCEVSGGEPVTISVGFAMIGGRLVAVR